MHFYRDLYQFVNAIKNGGLVIVFFLALGPVFLHRSLIKPVVIVKECGRALQVTDEFLVRDGNYYI